MVRAASLFAVGVWTVAFLACGEFGEANDVLGGGIGSSGGGSSGRGTDGGRDATPGGTVTQDAAPPPPVGCDVELGPRYSAPCLDFNTGVFVRADAVGGDGTMAMPFGKFSDAIAALNDKRMIFASRGKYEEDVVISQNVSIFGGFEPDFKSHTGATTDLMGVGGPYVLRVDGGVEAMRFEDLTVTATTVGAANGSSVAVLLRSIGGAASIVRFRRVTVTATAGAPGAAGGGGQTVERRRESNFPFGNKYYCNDTEVTGGVGGALGLSGGSGAGGGGAGGSGGGCPAAGGQPGTSYAPTDAAGPGVIDARTSVNLDDGSIALHTGTPGTNGAPGGGGGGGGSSRDSTDKTYNGGGGGPGGCGGTGGAGGTNGGHSIAVLQVQSYVDFVDSTLIAGTGAGGGGGGPGGQGAGGEAGGGPSGPTTCLSGGGGLGGHGLAGGVGGPGASGSSIALLSIGPAPTFQGTLTPGGVSGAGGQRFQQATIDPNGNLIPIGP